MKWQAIALEDAKKHLAASLGCTVTGEGLRIAAISECLRAASYLCSAPINGQDAWEPASSLSLTSVVRKCLSPVWPGLLEDTDARPGVMDVLESLGKLGELVRVDGGWLTPQPCAIRSNDGTAVVIGGGPSQMLSRGVYTKACGRARLVPAKVCEGWLDICEPDEWIGAPIEGLDIWSSRLFGEAKSRFTQPPGELELVSVYLNGGWIELGGLPGAEGVHLAKCQTGPKTSYFIGSFYRGGLQKMASVESSDARRLRFQLDIKTGRSTKVETEELHGLVKLRLYRRLPPEQEKALLLGWEIPAAEGEHPGLRLHVIPVQALPIVRCALKGLGIVLVERQSAKGRERYT